MKQGTFIVCGAILGGSKIVEDAIHAFISRNPGQGIKECKSTTFQRAQYAGFNLPQFSTMTGFLKEISGRAQLVDEKIKPALKLGSVICENWSISSRWDISKQFPTEEQSTLFAIEKMSHLGVEPDLTIFFDVNTAKAHAKLVRGNHKFPSDVEYFEEMRNFFIGDLEENYPGKFRILPAFGPQEEVNEGFSNLLADM